MGALLGAPASCRLLYKIESYEPLTPLSNNQFAVCDQLEAGAPGKLLIAPDHRGTRGEKSTRKVKFYASASSATPAVK